MFYSEIIKVSDSTIKKQNKNKSTQENKPLWIDFTGVLDREYNKILNLQNTKDLKLCSAKAKCKQVVCTYVSYFVESCTSVCCVIFSRNTIYECVWIVYT